MSPIGEKDLAFLIQWAFENQHAIAAWRLPFAPVHHLIVSRSEEVLSADAALEGLPGGFVFAPFDPTGKRLFIRAEFFFTFAGRSLLPPDNELEAKSKNWLNTSHLSSKVGPGNYFTSQAPETAPDDSHFVGLVERSVREIESGTFEKVVPSRFERIPLTEGFDVAQAFHDLCEKNPDALVSLVSTPTTGTWLGATPEVLVTVEQKKTFKTVALAGTQTYTGQSLRDVSWKQKDIEEQALVERYIINCFKRIRLREYEEHGPRTVVAGNLMHLKSEFRVDLEETNLPQLGSVMLSLLHPTAAVCGAPLQPARAFLAEHEGYDRAYYTGYLGPVNVHDNINIFVNLRCAQLTRDHAVLYAGAGVTIDSIASQELNETEIKLNTLRQVLTPKASAS